MSVRRGSYKDKPESGDGFMECVKHGRVMGRINDNYDMFCILCEIEAMNACLKEMPEEALKELLEKTKAATKNYSMGCHVSNNKCPICDKDWKKD